MFTLVFAIIFGLALSFFAMQNTSLVTITVANIPINNIPVWVIMVVSMLIGLVFASYFNVLNIITATFKLHDKDKSIKGADKEIVNLKDEISRLKEKNINLQAKNDKI